LVFYSEKPRLEFSLDMYQSAAQVLRHLDRLTFRARRGRAKAGAALDFLRKEVFLPEKGSRPHRGVQQIAVVIIESPSLDNVSTPASYLRRAGVTIYAAGTQPASESKDLEKIVTYPPWKHAIRLESFLQLSVVGNKLKKKLCPEMLSGMPPLMSFIPESTRQSTQEGRRACLHLGSTQEGRRACLHLGSTQEGRRACLHLGSTQEGRRACLHLGAVCCSFLSLFHHEQKLGSTH
jgi:collagen type VI alpha